MKVHKYEVTVYQSVLDYAHSAGTMQQRLYIPDWGVLGYRESEWKKNRTIDFFTDNKKTIEQAKQVVSGAEPKYANETERKMARKNETSYIGEYELPQLVVAELAQKIADAERDLKSAKSRLEASGGDLVSLIENISNTWGMQNE
jgi:hypothetical protein